MSFLIKWAINIIALFVVIHTVAGVSASNAQTVVVAALIIGLLNAFLRPILILLTLPFTVVTLGLFTLIINGLMFYLASKFVIGFSVVNFWTAFWAAIIFSILSFILNTVFTPQTAFHFRVSRHAAGPRQGHRHVRDDKVIDVEGKIVD